MKKDSITSVILICLIISSVALTFKIWFSEELWPDGYNFFVTTEKIMSLLPFGNDESDNNDAVAPLHESMFMPEKIVVAKSSGIRTIYSGSEDDFILIHEFSKSILNNLFTSQPEKVQVAATEYCDTIKNSSVFVEYPVDIPLKVIGHLCEVNDSVVFSDILTINGFVTVPGNNGCYVYMRDTSNGNVFRYSVEYDAQELNNTINKYASDNGSFMSAYELGFYKREDIEIEQPLSFDPFVFIDTTNENSESAIIRGINPFDKTDLSVISLDAINSIILAFGYNPNTIRRYTDSDGTLVLIEDYSTIKLHRTGILEFTTTTPKKGIDMQIHSDSSGSPQNVLDTIDSLTEILGGVWSALGMEQMPDIRFSSDVTDNYSDYALSFDYRLNGYPVILDFGGINHAIELEIKNNLLVSMKVCIRNYKITDEYSENYSTLEALDIFCEEPDISPDAEDLFLGYIDYGTSGKMYAHWNILESGGSVSSITETNLYSQGR